jgi:hypothetical protein
LASGLESDRILVDQDKVKRDIEQYIEKTHQTTGSLVPPLLEVRFAFVRRDDGIHGIAYSTIAGTNVDIDLDEALECSPGYVTPALFTAPPHHDNPHAGVAGEWQPLQVGPVTITVAMNASTNKVICLDAGSIVSTPGNPVTRQHPTALDMLHKALAKIRDHINNDKPYWLEEDCPLNWDMIMTYDKRASVDGIRFSKDGLLFVNRDKILRQRRRFEAFGTV